MLGAKDQHSKQFAAKMKSPGLRYSARHTLAILRRVMLSALLLVSGIAAQETGPALRGNWTARTAQGGSVFGTWEADATGLNGKTLADMFALTMEREVTGSWQGGRHSGSWRLSGAKGQPGSR